MDIRDRGRKLRFKRPEDLQKLNEKPQEKSKDQKEHGPEGHEILEGHSGCCSSKEKYEEGKKTNHCV